MLRLLSYLNDRRVLLVVCSGLGLCFSLSSLRTKENDVQGLKASLNDMVGGETGALVWEPSRGVFADFLLGRPLLFEARIKRGAAFAPRDVFRSLVRVSPEGAVLSLGEPFNLTSTSKSDEHNLQGNVSFAAWSSHAEQTPPSLSLIRFHAKNNLSASSRPKSSILDRLQIGLSRLVDTGTWAGLDRLDVVAPTLASSLSLKVDDQHITLLSSTDERTVSQVVAITEWSRAEKRAAETVASQAPLWVNRERSAVPWSHFFANILRKAVGVNEVARVESALFSARDRMLRLSYKLGHLSQKPPPTPSVSQPKSPEPEPKPGALANWPPRDITQTLSDADGRWQPWSSNLLQPSPEPLFYRTVLHTDPKRPYAELHLVAFDMRRLRLGMRAGYEDPEPEAGPPGSGHVPLEVAQQIVATFNGAFKSTHGAYGMKAEGRVLVQPIIGAATVKIDHSGRVGMGTWTATNQAADSSEFRQNLDALVAEGAVNPRGRTSWGEHVDATGVAIERSAICLHESGHLIYAWATEATGVSLAEGLKLAGCRYAMHLDMNPGHCTFALNNIESVDPLRAQGEVLDARMKVNAIRYVRWSPKDFFYLALRPKTPERPLTSLQLSYEVAPGDQPTPHDVPGIFTAKRRLGPLIIDITRIDAHRVSYQIALGSAERPNTSSPLLNESSYPNALVAWGLGHQTHGSRPGLSVERDVIAPASRGLATIALEKEQGMRILPPGEPLPERDGLTTIQLPAVARDGRLLDVAKELGGKRARHALCLDKSGALLWGSLEHDNIAPLAQTLLDLGCSLVLEADRGSRSPSYRARSGTDLGAQLSSEQTILYAIDQPMRPDSYLF